MEQGLIPSTTPPQTLATVFRALVVGMETQRRIDPDAIDTSDAATALATVLGVGASTVSSSPR